jgi:hypothetical protein
MSLIIGILLALTVLTTILAAVASLSIIYSLLKQRNVIYRRQYEEHVAQVSKIRRLLK